MTNNFMDCTLRDYFASQAIVGILAHYQNCSTEDMVNEAYSVANQMLSKRQAFISEPSPSSVPGKIKGAPGEHDDVPEGCPRCGEFEAYCHCEPTSQGSSVSECRIGSCINCKAESYIACDCGNYEPTSQGLSETAVKECQHDWRPVFIPTQTGAIRHDCYKCGESQPCVYDTPSPSQDKTDMITDLVNAYDEYIVLLGKELDELAPMANVHGWKSTRYEEGKESRRKIAELKKSLTNRGES